MKNKLNKVIAAGTALLVLGTALPVFAQAAALGVGINASASANVGTAAVNVGARAGITAQIGALIKNGQMRADQEIARRESALNKLSARVNAMVKISADEKTSLLSSIQTQIGLLNTLQAQIASDTSANSTTSLKADIQSITKSYRIFMLIIPQGALEAATDRVLDVAGMMTALSGQLQTRITAAQAAGNDMSASVSALAEMNAKISDANAQANAAASITANLKPDNGDQTVMAANTAALKDARAKIQASQQDLVAARKDAGTIVKALIAIKVSAAASTTP